MSLSDTSPAAQARLIHILRSIPAEEHFLAPIEMSEFSREMCRAGIRQQHPDWTDAQVAREVLRFDFFPQPLPAGLP